MYSRILVAIEHSDADRAVLTHIEQLAGLTRAPPPARARGRRVGRQAFRGSQAPGVRGDSRRSRVPRTALPGADASAASTSQGRLALGDPATELIKVAQEEQVDLIAMSTHGHRFLNDLIRGSTADRVRHRVTMPVLMVRARLRVQGPGVLEVLKVLRVLRVRLNAARRAPAVRSIRTDRARRVTRAGARSKEVIIAGWASTRARAGGGDGCRIWRRAIGASSRCCSAP